MKSQQIALVFGNSILGLVSGFAVIWLIGRSLGPEALGIIAFGLSATGLIGLLGNLGLSQTHVKIAAEGREFPECIGAFLLLQIVLNILILLVALAGTPLILSRYQADERIVLALMLAALLLGNLIKVPDTTFAARQETVKQQMPPLLANIGFVFIVWAALYLRWGVVGVALAYVLKAAVWSLWSFWMFRGYPIHWPQRRHLIRYLRFSLPLMAATIMGVVAINIDSIMIRTAWGTEELGYYYVAQRVVLGFSLLADAISIVLMPAMSAQHTSKQMGPLMVMTSRSQRYLVLIALPPAVVTVSLARPFLALLFGQQFVGATTALQLLTIYAFFRIVNQPYSDLIMASGKATTVGRIGVVFAVAALVLYPILIPKDLFGWPVFGLGAAGAAAALVVGILVNFVLFWYNVRRLYGRKIQPLSFQPIILSLPIGVALYLAAQYWSAGFLQLITLSVIGLILGYGGFISTGLLGASDLALLFQTINPKGILRYVASEIRSKHNV